MRAALFEPVKRPIYFQKFINHPKILRCNLVIASCFLFKKKKILVQKSTLQKKVILYSAMSHKSLMLHESKVLKSQNMKDLKLCEK